MRATCIVGIQVHVSIGSTPAQRFEAWLSHHGMTLLQAHSKLTTRVMELKFAHWWYFDAHYDERRPVQGTIKNYLLNTTFVYEKERYPLLVDVKKREWYTQAHWYLHPDLRTQGG
jgi:hypothetical protein